MQSLLAASLSPWQPIRRRWSKMALPCGALSNQFSCLKAPYALAGCTACQNLSESPWRAFGAPKIDRFCLVPGMIALPCVSWPRHRATDFQCPKVSKIRDHQRLFDQEAVLSMSSSYFVLEDVFKARYGTSLEATVTCASPQPDSRCLVGFGAFSGFGLCLNVVIPHPRI